MKSVVIVTPSNIEIEYRLAGAGSRVAAFIVDFAIQWTAIVFFALIVLVGFDRGIFGNRSAPSGIASGVVLVGFFLIYFGYFIFCELSMQGQSIGKRIFSLRVIRDNGQPIGFSQSLVRGLLRSSVDMIYVGLFVILFSRRHKRLGDMAAGTIVISEHHYTKREPSFLDASAQYWPKFLPDQFLLTPEERQLAEEFLARRDDMTDGGAAIGDKLVEYFKKYEKSREEMNFENKL
jgi:uncharacterized RDD family membrane protein YckC